MPSVHPSGDNGFSSHCCWYSYPDWDTPILDCGSSNDFSVNPVHSLAKTVSHVANAELPANTSARQSIMQPTEPSQQLSSGFLGLQY